MSNILCIVGNCIILYFSSGWHARRRLCRNCYESLVYGQVKSESEINNFVFPRYEITGTARLAQLRKSNIRPKPIFGQRSPAFGQHETLH